VPYGAYVNEAGLENEKRAGFFAVDGMLSTNAPDEAIKRACGSLPFLSVTEAFRKQAANDRLFYEVDLHMAPEGHALFAEETLPWVEKHTREAMKK